MSDDDTLAYFDSVHIIMGRSLWLKVRFLQRFAVVKCKKHDDKDNDSRMELASYRPVY